MHACVQKVTEFAIPAMRNSGHFLEQMGLYQECLESKLRYSLAFFMDKQTHFAPGLYIGLCLPEQCTNDIVKDTLNKVVGQITNYEVQKIVNDPQQYVFQKHWLFYPVSVLCILLVLLTILATALRVFNPKIKESRATHMKLLNTFGLQETLSIFTYKHNVFNVFNGFKAISMLWVIFGHEFSVRLKNDINAAGVPAKIQTFFYLFVLASFFAVDAFFFMGGFLVAYSFIKEKSKNPMKYPMALLHRVLRFWPSYLITILIYYSLFLHTGSGPVWFESQAVGQVKQCDTIWKPMLFVDNLVDNGELMCLGWGWYLQNDMQLFVVTLVLLFVYSFNKKVAKISIITLSLLSLILNIILAQVNGYVQVIHLGDFKQWAVYFPDIYIKPWIRCPPYLLGLFFGIQYMEYLKVKKSIQEAEKQQLQQSIGSKVSYVAPVTESPNQPLNRTSIQNEQEDDHRASIVSAKQQQLSKSLQRLSRPRTHIYVALRAKMLESKPLVYLLQIIGFGIIMFILLIPRTMQLGSIWPQTIHSLYLSTGKVFFVLGMYMIMLPSLLDVPNFSFFIMDTKVSNFIAKISFWTYLIHYMVVLQVNYHQRVDFYYSAGDILPMYIPIAIISLTLGFLGTIIVEVPFAKMEKMLINTMMGKKDTRKLDKVGSITQPMVQSVAKPTESEKE